MKRSVLVLLIAVGTGVVVLGGGGRLAMLGVRVVAGAPMEATVLGTLEVLLAGALFGGLGGVAYLVFDRLAPPGLRYRGVLFGLVAYAVVGIVSRSARAITLGLTPAVIAASLVLFGVMFVLYGVVVERLVHRVAGPAVRQSRWRFWWAVGLGTFGVVGIGSAVIGRRVPPALERVGHP